MRDHVYIMQRVYALPRLYDKPITCLDAQVPARGAWI